MASELPNHTEANEEPLLSELLDDPIAHLLMQMDGVERSVLDPLIEEISGRVEAKEAA